MSDDTRDPEVAVTHWSKRAVWLAAELADDAPLKAMLTEAVAECDRLRRHLSEYDSRLRQTLRLLRDFYVAYYKPDWAEGRTADDMTDEIRIYLDQSAREGLAEAQVPPDGDDPGGPEEGDRD